MTTLVERLRGGWNHDRNPQIDMDEAADRIDELERERDGLAHQVLLLTQERDFLLKECGRN